MAISTAVPTSAVARVVGIKTKFINTNVGGLVNLPQRVAIVGQGASSVTYDTTKFTVTSAFEAGSRFGFGSPVHLACLQLLPVNGDGVGSIPVTIYPLEDAALATPSAGDIAITGTPTVAGAFQITVNGIASAEFVIAKDAAVSEIEATMTSAVNGVLEMPVIAAEATGSVSFTSKWAGESANGITIAITGTEDTGVTFTVTQPTGGLVNPDVTDATDQFGGVWETMVINCLDVDDDTALDAFQTFGEGRWGSLVRKPLIVFTGHALTTPQEIVAITDLRKTDRVNSFLSNPGSVNLPFVSAAGLVARIVVVANDNPARDYGRQPASYLEAGADGAQWNYIGRNLAVTGGASTVEVHDGVVNVADTVTAYHPDGEAVPAYRFVKSIVKLQNVIFNVDLIFNTAEWDGAPLIPDDQPTVNPSAKKPKNAKAALNALATSLSLAAIISEPAYTKENTQAEIDSQNPDRLNAVFPVKLSGNVNINSIDLNFGFYFGTSTIIN